MMDPKMQSNFGYKNSHGSGSQPSGGSGEQQQTFNHINNQYNYNYNFNVCDPRMISNMPGHHQYVDNQMLPNTDRQGGGQIITAF